MKSIELTIRIISLFFSILVFYKPIFIIIGFFVHGKKYPETETRARFGILIAARNEELVIGNLIDSLHKQNYPKELIDIYVVADNCSDSTEQIAKEKGAIVYHRNDTEHVSKGYALKYLTEQMIKNNQFNQYDYFVIFDSDNIVDGNFIYEMNKALATGLDGCVCYRNSKNFESNVISSGYSIHWLFNNMHAHRPRSFLNLSTHATGTGYAFKKELIPNGWEYTDLTEDASMSLDMISEGKNIGYCEDAQIYDEQPTGLFTTFRQRLRWKRGTYYSFFSRFFKIIKGFFVNKGLRKKLSCYDCFFTYFPYDIVSMLLGISLNVILIINGIIDQDFNLMPLWKAILSAIISAYASYLLCGILAVIKERNKIHCKKSLLIIYTILYPWFDLISLPISVFAIFKKMSWHPIVHKDQRKIEDLKSKKQ